MQQHFFSARVTVILDDDELRRFEAMKERGLVDDKDLVAFLMRVGKSPHEEVHNITISHEPWCAHHRVVESACRPHPASLPHEDEDDEGFIEGALRRGE